MTRELGQPSGILLAGRFELVECMKRREFGETWKALDRRDGSPVVAKLISLDGVSSAVRLRLEHEATVLGRVNLPSRPVITGTDGPVMYLIQTYVEGRTLLERLHDGPLSVGSTLQLGSEVLRALQTAHELGVVHRDVKPANIIVGREEPIERAALIDFGLSRSGWLDPALRDEPVGTARYLAPETAGLVDADVDERADLYSLGVVLYECLTGEPPFVGADVGEVLRAHANVVPPPLRSVRAGIPGSLDALVHRLLAKDPAERYQSAVAALRDFEAINDGFRRGVADPAVAIGAYDRRRTLAEASFVGRVGELAALRTAVEDGPSGVVLVEAESGGGKSRLLDEVCLHLDASVRVLRGHGADRVARRPFQILDGVAAGLADECRRDPALRPLIQVALGDRAAMAVAALPPLADVLGLEPGAQGPEAYGEARTVEALVAVLDALAQLGRSFLVLLDDVQWADSLTVKVLAEWPARVRPAPTSKVVVVAAFRAEEVGPDHLIRSVPAIAHLPLSPFSSADITALCESMAGPLPADATNAVVKLAEGSPFMASAVLRGLVEADVLRHGPDGWRVDSEALSGAQTSRRAAMFLARRLELLGVPAQQLMSAGAVLGKEFDLDDALALASLAPEEAGTALEESRRRRVIWIDERTGRCAFTHDKLRETLLERLDPQLTVRLHRAAADRFELMSPRPTFELAYHFDAAGEAERSFPYALEAARVARRRHALDVAVAQYRIAEKGAVERDRQSLREVLEGLGEVLSLSGDYPAAEEKLSEALALAELPPDRSALEGKLGEVAFRRGDQVAARSYIEGALRQLGRRVPRGHGGFLLGALWELLVQAGHSLVPARLGRRPLEGADEQLLAARLYSRLAYIYWFSSGRFPCAWAHLRGMNLVERYPPTLELAQAWSEHAPVATMIPWFGRGLNYARKSYEVRASLGDEWGRGQSLSFKGVVLYAASRYAECIEACEEAVRLLSRTGDRWEENTAGWHIAFSHYRMGHLTKAVEAARAVHGRADAIGDTTSRGIALSVWSRASLGHVPAELLHAELALGTDDAHTAVEVRMGEGIRLLGIGDVVSATSMFDDALTIVKARGMRQEYVAPAYAWAATAHRARVEVIPAVAGRQRRRALNEGRRAARRACRVARFYRNNLPHALREAGLLAAAAGRQRRSVTLLRRSLAVAAAQGASHEQSLTELAMAIVDPRGGAVDAASATAAADSEADAGHTVRRALSEVPAADWNLSLADRFSTLMEAGREISAASAPASVYEAVRRAAVRLLRAERCHIVDLADQVSVDGIFATESGNPVEHMSTSLMRQALESRQPAVAGESGAADSSESLVFSNARSTLCAPICRDGRVVALLYVLSRHVAGLFRDEEIQLASFITTLAGAALDHVAGSEARFRSLVQNASDVITIVSADRQVIYQSDSATRVFGIDPRDKVGRPLADWVHPDDAGRVEADLAALAESGEGSVMVEFRVSDSNGVWRHAETAVTNLLGDPGVRGMVLNTRDVTERVRLEAELRHRAWHDIVTGLANRALFSQRVDRALAHAIPQASSFAVLFLDLDDFKSFNDTLGHATGDEILRVVAERLTGCVRPEDTVARFGGDEFALLLEGADMARAELVCQRLLAVLAQPIDVAGHQLEAQASIGVVLSAAAEGAEGLLAAADAALYVAKARGKRRFEVFEPSMRSAAVARAGLRQELDHALDRRELHLVYQPVVAVASGELRGFEALLRWARPNGSALGPDSFIALAEESGAIVPIGAWVLAEAARQARRWIDAGFGSLSMAVNVSARQLQHPGLVDEIRSAVEAAAIDPSVLVVEITESATVEDFDATVAKLNQIKELGVRVAVDDFGTGYSALSYLHRLPVDILKIDRSFVSGLGRNSEDLAIVQTVISLAAAFGLETVAEGVETLEQVEILADLGCQLAQGYNWKRPSSPADITEWILAGAPDADGHRVRVVVADDSAGIRAVLTAAIGADGRFAVVGEAADGEDAVRLARRVRPDIVLLDLMMPGSDGLSVLARLREAAPGCQVVILTAADVSSIGADTILAASAVLDKTRDLAAVIDQLADLGVPA